MAYASVEELAAALRIAVTPANQDALQACLDAAAREIDAAIDHIDPAQPLPEGDEVLANRVNLARGVEWYKTNDAAFGIIGMADTGALRAPRNTFARHGASLMPARQQFGVT